MEFDDFLIVRLASMFLGRWSQNKAPFSSYHIKDDDNINITVDVNLVTWRKSCFHGFSIKTNHFYFKSLSTTFSNKASVFQVWTLIWKLTWEDDLENN